MFPAPRCQALAGTTTLPSITGLLAQPVGHESNVMGSDEVPLAVTRKVSLQRWPQARYTVSPGSSFALVTFESERHGPMPADEFCTAVPEFVSRPLVAST